MNYHVAVKFEEYTAQFSFDTPEERAEFIEINREMHPDMEVICTEEKAFEHKAASNA